MLRAEDELIRTQHLQGKFQKTLRFGCGDHLVTIIKSQNYSVRSHCKTSVLHAGAFTSEANAAGCTL